MSEIDEFYTCDRHHKGTEVFGLQKWKLDTPIGTDNEIHRPNTLNFSCSHVGKRITRA